MHFNFVHIHLAINHSPLYTELSAFLLMLIGIGRKNRTLVTAGLVFCIVAALSGGVVFFTGDQAKDIIDGGPPIAGVEKLLIGPHQTAATNFLIISLITGALAIIALYFGRGGRLRPLWFEWLLVFLIFVSLFLAAFTGLLGGRIHHQEVRYLITG
ncbi:MAG: hypothetical protein M3041_10820 [Acidobacteriota bacterium]|nr:hypothetical protein [Acidobacteriota bacterium]